MSELAFLTLAEAGARIRDGKLSPVAYAEALLDRTARLEPTIHAYVAVTRDAALAEARAAEAEIKAGRWRGPFHGIPYALKDIIDAAGVATTGHSKQLEGVLATADAPVTAKLRAAGGVLLGKLSTHEFAVGGPSFDLPWPPARNPWDPARFPGGSSSGSGAGLAAGLFPATLGSDTGGSIRNPASMCGITGLKPTYGLVSRRGVLPLSFSLDHIGPMTRTVRDNALMLQVIAGHDPQDPASAAEPVPDYTRDLDAGVAGMTIGVIRHFYTKDQEADPAQVAALDDAVKLLEKQGARIKEITLAPLLDFSACGQIILAAESYAIHEQWLREKPEDYGARCRERLFGGAPITAGEYMQALRWRLQLRDRTLAAFAGLDAAITASSMDAACLIDDNETLAKNYWRQARMPFNVTGQPGLVVPAGFKDGLPLSIQIVGQPFGEVACYRIGQAYERATGWVEKHPAL